MPTTADRVFRDFVRYTGDGLANEPVGTPLPVGDPASAVHNPRKADIRQAMNELLGLADLTDLGVPWVDSLADYTTDTIISYGVGNNKVAAGDYIKTRAEFLSLLVLAAGATSYNAINGNGVKVNIVSRATTMPAGVGDQFSSAKYDLIGGVLRQNSADRTQWNFLNDSAHIPVGFDPARPLLASDGTTNLAPRAAGQSLLFFFKQVTDQRQLNVALDGYYDRVVAVNAWADETLSKDWGISLGAKVTRSGLLVYGSMHKTRHGRIYWSGSQWVMDEDSWHPTDTVSVSWDSTGGVLTVTHGWLPGQNLRLDVDMRATSGTEGGIVATPFLPVRGRIISDTQFTVRFLADGSVGPGFSPRTGAPGTGMSFRWTKSYDGPVTFDGTNGWDSIPWDEGDTGNIWVHGFMRREAPF